MPRQRSRTAPHRYRWSSSRAVDGPGSAARPKLLLICDFRPREAATVIDHIEAIRRWSRSDVFVLPTYGDLPDELDLDAFDGLVIHYNVVMSVDSYLSPLARWRIARYGGVKGAFIQDEYRFVNRTTSVMRTLGVNVLFTCVPEDQVALVYPHEALPQLRRTVSVLTGYVPADLLARPTVPYEARPIDVGYRARRLPPWLGRLGMEKAEIADRFVSDAPALGLTVDISTAEEDRLYGEAWLDFLETSKATLGGETGASVFDFDGSIEARIRAYLTLHPDAPFEELHRRFLADVDGRINFNQISPRCFEAAALGTLMVLYPGQYSGALEPWRHYVPLQKDHGNVAEVVEAIRDPVTWRRITAQARAEVAENPRYSYQSMVKAMDDGLDLGAGARPPMSAAEFERIADRNFAQLPSTRMHAWGLPPAVNRLRRLPARVMHLMTLSPTSIVLNPPGPENQRRWRRRIRAARALAYWVMRPGTIPLSVIRAYGRALLDELSELTAIQVHGRRALQCRAGTPFVIVINEEARELRIALGEDASDGVRRLDHLPADLAWVAAIVLDLSDPWLVPIGIRAASDRRFDALSEVFQSRPDVGRRLLAGSAPWCAVVGVSDPQPAQALSPAGADAV